MLWHDETLPSQVIDALWQSPDHLIANGRMLKDGDRCTVVKVDVPGGGQAMVFKRYNAKDSFHTAAHLALRSRARWCWNNARRLIAGGLHTPAPLACVEERLTGVFRVGSYLLTQFVAGTSLRDLIESGKPETNQLRDLAAQFSTIWQTLGQLRIGHGDMKATNFIVDPEGQLWLIDLDGMRVYRTRTLLRRERRNDVARFMRNWQERPEVAAIFRARIGTV